MKIFRLLPLLWIVVACQEQPPDVKQFESRLGILESRIKSLQNDSESKIKSLQEKLESRIMLLESNIEEMQNKYAILNTQGKSYDLMRNSFGVFPVVCKSVSAYLDGYELKIAVGNPTNFIFRGAKVKCRWWKDGMKEKEFEVTDVFSPRVYTTITAKLTPLTSAEVKNVHVFLEFGKLSLLND